MKRFLTLMGCTLFGHEDGLFACRHCGQPSLRITLFTKSANQLTAAWGPIQEAVSRIIQVFTEYLEDTCEECGSVFSIFDGGCDCDDL